MGCIASDSMTDILGVPSHMLDDPPPTMRITARIPPDLRDALAIVSNLHDRTFSAELRRAMRLYLATPEAHE